MFNFDDLISLDVFKETLEQLDSSVFITNKEGNILYVNPAFEINTGYSPKEAIGQNPRFIQSGEHDKEVYRQLWKTITAGHTWKGELKNKRKDGNRFWSKVSISPVKSAGGEIKYYVAIEHDVTIEKKEKEERTRSERILNDSQSLSHTGGWYYDVANNEMFWTEELYKIFGFRKSDGLNLFAETLTAHQIEDRFKVISAFKKLLSSGKAYDLTVQITDTTGNKKWIKSKARAIQSETGVVNKIIGTIKDITKQVQAKESLISAYKERGFLLSEIHHRVKNNLAVISSLLQLQAMTQNDEKITLQLNESLHRIHSISLIHEQLYLAENFSEISLTLNIITQLEKLKDSYPTQTHIEFDINMEEVVVNINQAQPLGLLINEILSNTFKYAFQGRKEGRITIRLANSDKEVSLLIADNGIGMDEETYQNSTTIGNTLIKTLLQQLNARSSVKLQGGVSYEILFAKSSSSGSVAIHQIEKTIPTDIELTG